MNKNIKKTGYKNRLKEAFFFVLLFSKYTFQNVINVYPQRYDYTCFES